MKYKAGDKVRVRSDLVVDRTYPKGECRFINSMLPFVGKEITISGIHSSGIRYLIEGNSDYWTDEMLEDVKGGFKLPEKWCIKLSTKEINDAVNSIELWGGGRLSWYNTDSYTDHYIGFDGNYSKLLVSDGYTEITFDQFKKYVLKGSESAPVKEEVKFEVGKWYEYSAEYINHKTYAKYSSSQSVGGRFYYDEIITENNGFKKGHNWSVLTCKPVLLTDLSEIQQYLPENHPDKIKKRTKKVEDLKYPDVVHCNSQGERDSIKKHLPKVRFNDWSKRNPWLLIGGGEDSGPYPEGTYIGYVNYEFSDIIFPGEKVVKEWNVGSYAVLLNNYMGIAKGTVSRIDCDYGHGVTISHTIYNGDPANLSKNSECKWFPTLKEAQVFSDELLGRNKIETKPILSKEELLAEAKRRYPVGTKYKCASNNSSDIFVLSSDDWSNSILDDVVYAENGKGCLYYEGDWAEIVSEPIAEKEVERLSFYVKYNTSFTEDLYNKLVDWCVKNNAYKTRGWSDTYKGLIENGFFIYDSASLNKQGVYGYGVDNNRQSCINEYSIQQVKELIGYKEAFEHPKYVECIGLKEVDVMFWSNNFTIGEIYLVEEYYGTTIFKINRVWCDKSQFKPSTKEAFDKQGKSGVKEKEGLIHTGNMGLLRGIYNIPVSPEDCFDSDEIYVPIIKTEVKQIKL